MPQVRAGERLTHLTGLLRLKIGVMGGTGTSGPRSAPVLRDVQQVGVERHPRLVTPFNACRSNFSLNL
jgi:hypothetical protein